MHAHAHLMVGMRTHVAAPSLVILTASAVPILQQPPIVGADVVFTPTGDWSTYTAVTARADAHGCCGPHGHGVVL